MPFFEIRKHCVFPQFVMASDVKMEVVCVLCPMYQDWKKETVGNVSKRNAEGCDKSMSILCQNVINQQ